MNLTMRSGAKIGIVLCSALLGYTTTTRGQPSVSVAVSVSVPTVEIRTESDFYEPLTPLGEWVVIGSYGRCWRPSRVEAGWRPYSEGYWQRTDAGWFWVSDEPWGWATYHYGRWNFADQYGWYWVPQTEWAPAWVSWHSGGGYLGWAPLYPPGVTVILPQSYVFVEERHFMEPVHRSSLVVVNTTIINQTAIKEAPTVAVVEKAVGRKVGSAPVQELRHKTEAAVVTKQPAPDPKNGKPPGESSKSVPAAADTKPAARPDAKPEATRPAAAKEPGGQNSDKQTAKPDKTAPPADKSTQPPPAEKPAASEKGGSAPADKGQDKKSKE